jgi:hypothetical protein
METLRINYPTSKQSNEPWIIEWILDTIEGLEFATGDGVGESESYETIGS